jgi:hypothetical protein
LGKRRRKYSFTDNARKEGGRTLIKIPWSTKKASSNFMHNQLLSPLLNIFPPTNLLACMPLYHLLATNPNPDYFKTTMFGAGADRHEIS